LFGIGDARGRVGVRVGNSGAVARLHGEVGLLYTGLDCQFVGLSILIQTLGGLVSLQLLNAIREGNLRCVPPPSIQHMVLGCTMNGMYRLQAGSTLVKAEDLANNTSVDALWVEPLSYRLEPLEILHPSVRQPTSLSRTLTVLSRFLTDRVKTSRVFLVQCGRQGNSSMSVLATLWSFRR
jgi:hypothetical protein